MQVDIVDVSMLDRIVKVLTEDLYSWTGKLEIAERQLNEHAIEPFLAGSRRQRYEKVLMQGPDMIRKLEDQIEMLLAAKFGDNFEGMQ